MIRKTLIVFCVVFFFALGALMAGTWFRPISRTGPQEVGPDAHGLVVRGGGFLVHYWRYTDNPPSRDKRVGIRPFLLYETEVKHGATALMYSWANPCPHRLTVEGTNGTLVTTYFELTLWLPLLAIAAYPAVVFLRGPVLRWRRQRKGLCVACGYNLTGNVSGVCSECGREVVKP